MKLYTPPPGYYDLPFTWAFDASALTNGLNYPNQIVYIKGGYGDFILRRIVGLSQILNPAGGQYQIQDGQKNYIEQYPVFSGGSIPGLSSADDIGLVPELWYPEQGGIRFDLFKILKPANFPAQLAFQGVRRMKGIAQRNPNYRSNPKSFTYTMSVQLGPTAGNITTGRVLVDNYDFELYQLIILAGLAQTLQELTENAGGVQWTNFPGNPPPNNVVTLSVPDDSGTPNLPLTITVAGTTITVQLSTNAAGVINTTNLQLAQAWQLNAAAAALLQCQYVQGSNPGPIIQSFVPGGPQVIGFGTGIGSSALPVSTLWLYDRNRVQVSNIPLLDIYMDGAPGGVYKNGAIVTPLWYPKDSQIQIDFTSLGNPAQVVVYLIGKKYYPC